MQLDLYHMGHTLFSLCCYLLEMNCTTLFRGFSARLVHTRARAAVYVRPEFSGGMSRPGGGSAENRRGHYNIGRENRA